MHVPASEINIFEWARFGVGLVPANLAQRAIGHVFGPLWASRNVFLDRIQCYEEQL